MALGTVTVTGADTVQIAGRLMTESGDGDVGLLEFPNDLAKTKRAKNGNAVIADDQSGGQGDFTYRTLRGGGDDKFLNNLLAQQRANIVSTPLLTGKFTKVLGDGQGNRTNDRYLMSGGTIKKIPPAKSNVEGDTEQGFTVYSFHFANVDRVLG